MVWSAPKTYTAGAVLTAAELNQYQRDNFNETCPPTVTTAGDMVFADAANSMGSRLAIGDAGSYMVSDGTSPVWRETGFDTLFSDSSTTQTTTSASYTSTMGGVSLPLISVDTGTQCLVLFGAQSTSNDTISQKVFLAFSISGATTLAAADTLSALHESGAADEEDHISMTRIVTGLTTGTNSFQMEVKVSANTGTVVLPYIGVLPL
jgi:hypothetical protein